MLYFWRFARWRFARSRRRGKAKYNKYIKYIRVRYLCTVYFIKIKTNPQNLQHTGAGTCSAQPKEKFYLKKE